MEKHEPLSWHAHEYEHRERTDNWYVALGIFAVGGAVAAFILGNALFSVFILAAAFGMALFASKPPVQHSFSIAKKGIAVGRKLYPWNSLESFWILDDTYPPKLLLKSTHFLMPLIVIPLLDIDPDTVELRLKGNLRQEELAEPFAERIMDAIGW